MRTFLDRTIDLLAPDPDSGSLSIRLEAGDALVIEINATGSDGESLSRAALALGVLAFAERERSELVDEGVEFIINLWKEAISVRQAI